MFAFWIVCQKFQFTIYTYTKSVVSELLDFRCGNNLALCASRMNVCVQCFSMAIATQRAPQCGQQQEEPECKHFRLMT